MHNKPIVNKYMIWDEKAKKKKGYCTSLAILKLFQNQDKVKMRIFGVKTTNKVSNKGSLRAEYFPAPLSSESRCKDSNEAAKWTHMHNEHHE